MVDSSPARAGNNHVPIVSLGIDPTGAEPYRTGMVSLRMVSADSQINFANVFWIGGAPGRREINSC